MLDASELDGVTDSFTASDAALFDALLFLEQHADVEPGEPFQTTRVAMIVESNLTGITADCSLYKLERDGWIKRTGVPGKGTTVTILKRSS